MIVAWLLIAAGFFLLTLCRNSVVGLLSNGAYLDGLPTARVTPRGATLAMARITKDCVGTLPSGTETRLRTASSPFSGSYDSYYHTRVNRSSFGYVTYVRGLHHRVLESHVARGLAECFSRKAFQEIPLILGERERIDSRVLWLYVLIERRGVADFVVWPDAEIPEAFDPWARPWAREIVSAAGAHRRRVPTDQGMLFETWPFFDAFTQEQIVSLPLFQRHGDLDITAVVDVQAGSTPSIYARMVCLNLVISLAILCLSMMVMRSVDSYFLKTFYRAWLVMTLLYVVEACGYFSVTLAGRQVAPKILVENMVPILSVANNLLFLLTALVSRNPRDGRRQRRRTAMVGLLVALPLATSEGLRGVVSGVALSEGIESVLSAVVLCIMGYSLITVFVGCAESLQGRGEVISGGRSGSARIKWTILCAGMIGAFFLASALLQLSIPFWLRRPELEELFFFTSVPMKVGFVAIFFVVVLVELYWEKFKADNLFFETSGNGVIEVDNGFRVLSVNFQAAQLINLSPAFLRGKHLNQILFRSLAQAEATYGELAERKSVQKTLVTAKRFPRGDDDLDCIDDVEVHLQARITGRGLEKRPRAVFLVTAAEAA